MDLDPARSTAAGYNTVTDGSFVCRCDAGCVAVTAADVSIIFAVADGLTAVIFCGDAACCPGICRYICTAVDGMKNIFFRLTDNTAHDTMGSTHQLCLAGQISCLTFFSNLTFVYAGDSADFRFSGDRKSASDCNDFCRTSFCVDFDLTLCLIDADDPADRFAVCCLDRPVCGIVFVIRNLDHSAVSSGDPSGVTSGCRDICIACILLYNTIGKIPSDNAAKTAVSRDGFGRLRTAAFDCSGTVSDVCCAGFGSCRVRFCRRSTAAVRSDVDPGDSAKIIQCCISEMLAERTFVDQSGI